MAFSAPRPSKDHSVTRKNFFPWREIVLTMLLIILGATVAILSQTDKERFGLPSSSEPTPVLGDIPLEILSRQQLLTFQLPDRAVSAPSVKGVPKDFIASPPAVEDAQALNTRAGGEIALFWKNPIANARVNIRRQEGNWNPLLSGSVIAEDVADEWFLDETVADGVHYSYLLSVVASDDAAAQPSRGVVVNGLASDETIPAPPRNVTVRSTTDAAIIIQWDAPMEKDIVAFVLYRSETEGQRGALLAQIPVEATSFTDTAVVPNTMYYYTVVALDAAGNVSSADIPASRMGNPLPFEPPSSL